MIQVENFIKLLSSPHQTTKQMLLQMKSDQKRRRFVRKRQQRRERLEDCSAAKVIANHFFRSLKSFGTDSRALEACFEYSSKEYTATFDDRRDKTSLGGESEDLDPVPEMLVVCSSGSSKSTLTITTDKTVEFGAEECFDSTVRSHEKILRDGEEQTKSLEKPPSEEIDQSNSSANANLPTLQKNISTGVQTSDCALNIVEATFSRVPSIQSLGQNTKDLEPPNAAYSAAEMEPSQRDERRSHKCSTHGEQSPFLEAIESPIANFLFIEEKNSQTSGYVQEEEKSDCAKTLTTNETPVRRLDRPTKFVPLIALRQFKKCDANYNKAVESLVRVTNQNIDKVYVTRKLNNQQELQMFCHNSISKRSRLFQITCLSNSNIQVSRLPLSEFKNYCTQSHQTSLKEFSSSSSTNYLSKGSFKVQRLNHKSESSLRNESLETDVQVDEDSNDDTKFTVKKM